MKRKKVAKKSHKIPSVHSYLIRFFIGIFSVVIIVGIGSLFIPSHLPFCANSISCIKDLSGKKQIDAVAIFNDKKILEPSSLFADAINSNTAVLGASVAPGQKHIYVDLTKQTLYAYQGKTLVMQTLISSGKWHPTPDGTFAIWIKLRYTRMTGGTGADFYDLPNVPYVMYFANDAVSEGEGFSLHGAYWHDNFGHPMSHGCINMRIVDAEKLYNWADPPTTGDSTLATLTNPGTQVTITGTAPGVTAD